MSDKITIPAVDISKHLWAATPGLTNRQRQILADRINGHSWRTIATAYHITEATARGHHKAALTNIEKARKDAT